MAIERLGIVGSGIMGSGIAEVAAKAGVDVVLRSRKQETADAMLASLAKSLAKQVDRGKLAAGEAEAVEARVSATADLDALADCDLVVESVVEDLAVKKQLFGELDRIVKDGAILASNRPPARGRDGGARPSAPSGVAASLLKPGAARAWSRSCAPCSARRHDRRGPGVRRGLGKEPSRSPTGRASS